MAVTDMDGRTSAPTSRETDLPRAVVRVSLMLAGLIFVAWLPANLAMPLGRDQGIFAWVGQVLLAGGIPYVDAWEVKGPVSHYLYALGMAVFGESPLGVRLFDNLLLAAATLALVLFARRRGVPLWGWVTGFLLFASYGGGFWHTAQVDGWISYGILLAILLLWHEPSRLSARAAVAVGLLLSLAVLVKPNFALFGLLPLLAYWWRDANGRQPLANILWCALGGLVPIVVFLAAYGLRGQLHVAWDVVVAFNLESHFTQRQVTLAKLPLILTEVLVAPRENGPAIWLLHALALVGLIDLWRRDRRGALLLATGWVCGWLVGVSQNKGFFYHFMPMYACAAALAAHAVVLVLARAGGDWRLRLRDGMVALLLLLLLPVLRPLYQAVNFWTFQAGTRTTEVYESQFCKYDDGLNFCHKDIATTATFLRANTAATDTVYVWGFEALLHLESDRASPTRYGFNYPMVVGSPRYAAAAKDEVMAALTARPPRAIVVQERDRSNITPLTSREQLAHFTALQALIERDYVKAFASLNFTVYLRRGP